MSHAKMNILNTRYEQGMWHKFLFRQAQNIHKRMVHKNSNFYVKPNDIISHRPSLFNYHEPHLEALFQQAAKTHDEFLLDIGANIGMTSVMVGHYFKEIHCVEPNTTVAKILDVNTELAGLSVKTKIHRIGLGQKTATQTLTIPKENFGGAYISSGNAYNSKNASVDRQNIDGFTKEIEIKNAHDWFAEIFAQNPSWQNGVIKIDVEGFEMIVLDALLSQIPAHISVIVIMENFLNTIDFKKFDTRAHDLEWYGFYKKKHPLKSLFFKCLGMSSYYEQLVRNIDPAKAAPHDLIVHFTPR